MSYTNLQIITMAYVKAGIVDETLSPSATQQSNALTTLNAYLAMREGEGMKLGWYPQTSTSATAPLRDEYVYPVVLLLARQLASDAGQPIQDPDLIQQIKDAEAALAKMCRRYFESDLGELSRAQGSPLGGTGWTL
jgi:hypothetical protein